MAEYSLFSKLMPGFILLPFNALSGKRKVQVRSTRRTLLSVEVAGSWIFTDMSRQSGGNFELVTRKEHR